MAQYKKLTLAGLWYGVRRLSDSVDFTVPKPGESEAGYLQNGDYRRYKAETTADPSLLLAADPEATLPPAPDFGTDLPANYADQVADTVTQLRTYLGVASPTLAQSVGALKLLIRLIFFLVRRGGVN